MRLSCEREHPVIPSSRASFVTRLTRGRRALAFVKSYSVRTDSADRIPHAACRRGARIHLPWRVSHRAGTLPSVLGDALFLLEDPDAVPPLRNRRGGRRFRQCRIPPQPVTKEIHGHDRRSRRSRHSPCASTPRPNKDRDRCRGRARHRRWPAAAGFNAGGVPSSLQTTLSNFAAPGRCPPRHGLSTAVVRSRSRHSHGLSPVNQRI